MSSLVRHTILCLETVTVSDTFHFILGRDAAAGGKTTGEISVD